MIPKKLLLVVKTNDAIKIAKVGKVKSELPCILLFSEQQEVELYLGSMGAEPGEYSSIEISPELCNENKLQFFKMSRNDGSFETDMYGPVWIRNFSSPKFQVLKKL